MSQEQMWLSWGLNITGPGKTPVPNLSNTVAVLNHDPTLIGRVWYDQFLDRVLTTEGGPRGREWTDIDDLNLTLDLQDRLGVKALTVATVSDAVRQVAHRRSKHCVRDWLDQLRWDGTPRIDEAFEDHWGVECCVEQPCEYVRAVSRNFFVGLVARIYQPGCQLDTMVVFEGPQGIRKTSALRVLGGDWYGLAHESVTSKDFYGALRGKWLIEIGELEAFSKAEVTRVKTAISTPVDRYRSPYERHPRDYPRACVFAGTTNADAWGTDTTGLRRFWPVKCGAIDVDTLDEARDQLFAEAVAAYRAGATWWQVPETAAAVQASRQEHDEWTTAVIDWADEQRLTLGFEHLTIPTLAAAALKIPIADLDKNTQMRIARVLNLHGWQRMTRRSGGKLYKAWLPPAA